MAYYNLIYANNSKRMLRMHIEFLSRVSVKASEKLYQEYLIGIENIKQNPYGYQYFYDKKKYRRYLFYKRYLIIYLIEKNTIYIIYIVDVRQNYFKYILKS